MSRIGQARCAGEVGSAAVLVATFAMPPDSRYTWHIHDDHQLAWAANGVLTVVTDAGTWVLPPSRALWIPAGVAHETIASGSTTMKSLYLRPGVCTIIWTRPQPVAAGPLLAELINYLAGCRARPPVSRPRRGRAARPTPTRRHRDHRRPMPRDSRARDVARALLDNPADPRSLHDWGRHVGASARTLARAFRTDTGLGFDRWRTLTRLQAALPELAAGAPVTNVSRHVGYHTTSAFVAAFRRETGLTPGAYFHQPPQ